MRAGEEPHLITQLKIPPGLDFEALRDAIERSEPDRLLEFYAHDAEVCVLNADAPRSAPFELVGKAEIAKYLRAAFEQDTYRRIEGEVFEEERIEYREMCEYPDGSRISVATTLEVREGVISRQVEMVSRGEGRREVS